MSTPAPTDFYDHVEWLKREVAIPGTFSALFPDTSDDDLAAALVDGLYRAKLDGWLPSAEASPDELTANSALSLDAVAVVIVYTSYTFLRNQLTNLATRQTYKAPGGLEYTTEHAATVISERLKEIAAEKTDLLLMARRVQTARAVFMHDGYAIRATAFYGYELPAYVGNMPVEFVQR